MVSVASSGRRELACARVSAKAFEPSLLTGFIYVLFLQLNFKTSPETRRHRPRAHLRGAFECAHFRTLDLWRETGIQGALSSRARTGGAEGVGAFQSGRSAAGEGNFS